MFGVVICPHCEQARGVRLSAGKSRCPRCGATYDVGLLKIYFITEKESELAEAVRSAALQLKERSLRLPDFEIDQDISMTVSRAAKGAEKRHLTKEEIDAISLELIEKQGAFTLDAFEKILSERYPEDGEKIMERLRAEDKIRSDQAEEFDSNLRDDMGSKRTYREEKIISVLHSLTENQGSFTREDLKRALDIATKDELEELMSKLLDKGIILETKLGIFKMV